MSNLAPRCRRPARRTVAGHVFELETYGASLCAVGHVFVKLQKVESKKTPSPFSLTLAYIPPALAPAAEAGAFCLKVGIQVGKGAR